jgi:hypothetical protein
VVDERGRGPYLARPLGEVTSGGEPGKDVEKTFQKVLDVTWQRSYRSRPARRERPEEGVKWSETEWSLTSS